MANNFTQAGIMPGQAIRVPYQSFTNGQRVIARPTQFTMQPNGLHIANGAYMPSIPFGNNLNVIPIRRMPPQQNIFKSFSIPREAFFMRLLSFAEHLGQQETIQWKELTNHFFTDDTSMKYTLWAPHNHTPKRFEIKYQVIPRFYQTFFESGVVRIQLILGNPNLAQNQVECPSASIVYYYKNGIQVVAPGRLKVIFNTNLKMMDFDFVTTRYTEFFPKQRIHEYMQSPLNEYGIPHKTMRCLEVGEGVDYMQEVMMHTINNGNIGPLQALSIIASQSTNNINMTGYPVVNSVTSTPIIQNSPLVKKEMKNDVQNYNGAPPTPNCDLKTVTTPVATPTLTLTPKQTPTLVPSPLAPNANDIGSPHLKKCSTQSPAISESTLKRPNDNGTLGNKKKQRNGSKK